LVGQNNRKPYNKPPKSKFDVTIITVINIIQKIKFKIIFKKFFETCKTFFLMWNLQIGLIISQARVAIVPSLNNNIYLKLRNHVTTNKYALLYIVNPLL
jgi:hypothetical protein